MAHFSSNKSELMRSMWRYSLTMTHCELNEVNPILAFRFEKGFAEIVKDNLCPGVKLWNAWLEFLGT